jgi:hypothetical protein
MDPIVLVVMEHGSEWPARANGDTAAGCVALRQEPCEGQLELLRRIYERVRSVERGGGAVELAILSCNDDASRGALAGRIPLARALLATVLREGRGRLELVARSSTPHRARQSLEALAETLAEALVGDSASVCARFIGEDGSVDPPMRPRRRSARAVYERRPAA